MLLKWSVIVSISLLKSWVSERSRTMSFLTKTALPCLACGISFANLKPSRVGRHVFEDLWVSWRSTTLMFSS